LLLAYPLNPQLVHGDNSKGSANRLTGLCNNQRYILMPIIIACFLCLRVHESTGDGRRRQRARLEKPSGKETIKFQEQACPMCLEPKSTTYIRPAPLKAVLPAKGKYNATVGWWLIRKHRSIGRRMPWLAGDRISPSPAICS